MSTIERLSIRGIRSFGATSEDVQELKFTSPVTLILGENGCGKTTIIECLKYALTGDMPPGSGKGQSFIHDPKIFDSTECLGQVKLMVKTLRGEKYTVCRSMKYSFKRGKPTFETLDGTIYLDFEGQKAAISKRCADINAEMCQYMGVSKAIINNVIFCHQEESSWPLDEAKKLKEKFDAIFGTTEYNKAIEKMIKLRKSQMDELKSKEADLKVLAHIKATTDSKNLALHAAQKKLDDLKKERDQLEDDMKPIQDRLSKIFMIEREIGELQAKKIELSTKLKNCQEQSNSLKSKIKKLFDGSLSMLDQEIRSFREKTMDKKNQLQQLEDKLQSIKFEEKKIQNTLTDLDRRRMSLIHQRQQEQDYLSERVKKIMELCKALKINVPDDIEETPENVNSILESIKKAFAQEDKRIAEINLNNEKVDQDMQQEIDKLRESKVSIESDISSKNEQKKQLERDRLKNQNEITQIEKSAQMLQTLTREIEKLTKTYDDYSASIDLDGLKKGIAEKKENINKFQEKVEKLDERITFLNSISKQTNEISLKEKEFEKRESEMRRVKNKHSDNLKKLFPNREITSNYKRTVQTLYDTLQKQINDLNKNINNSKLREKELQIMRKNQKDEITKFEKELEKCEDKIYEKCHSTDYEELVARAKESIEKTQLEYGALKSSEAMYKRYIQKIEEEPCCPLCHKDMQPNEASDLSAELSDEIRRLPENIQRIEQQLVKEQKKYEELLSLKPVIEKVETLKTDIPKCKEKLKSTEEKLSETAKEVESNQMLTAEPSAHVDLVNSILGDMSLLDEAIKDTSRLQTELEKLKAKLPSYDSTVSLDDLQLEKTTVSAELKSDRALVDKMQSQFERESDTLNQLREKRNSLKDKQIKLQEGVQALTQLKVRRDEIAAQIDKITKEIDELRNKLEPLKVELNAALDKKQRTKDLNRKKLNEETNKLDGLKKIDSEIQRYTKELKNLAELNLVKEIENLKKTLKRTMDEQTSKAKANADTTAAIENLKTDILNQELVERDLKDNRELKTIQEKVDLLQSQYDELTKDMGERDFKNVSREKDELTRKQDNIRMKKGEILGQMGEVNNQVNALTKELNQPQYKDCIKNYRKSYYEVQILKKIILDLGEYRLALERALMQFHSEKMEKINRLIREFWRQIYRGNDIDYIQIHTDEMKNEGADKKRTYNYRVIQSKNNKEIDMRGRCSAGQRVLASLIIRMALAETFSSNCGVLALDEPTTNLDRNNILSLCEALNRIVEERQSQSNFMLIIITHDEEFISTLGRIEYYNRVTRNEDGKSVVRRHRRN